MRKMHDTTRTQSFYPRVINNSNMTFSGKEAALFEKKRPNITDTIKRKTGQLNLHLMKRYRHIELS